MKLYDFTCLKFSVKTFIWSSLMAISSHITSILGILNFFCAVMSRIYWFKIVGNILLNKKITHVSSYKSFYYWSNLFDFTYQSQFPVPSMLPLPPTSPHPIYCPLFREGEASHVKSVPITLDRWKLCLVD